MPSSTCSAPCAEPTVNSPPVNCPGRRFSSGAAVTKRLRVLQERGLIDRRSDARDRRVAYVRLTDEGRELVDGLLPQQLAYERAVLSGLDAESRDRLSAQLSELLVQLEGRIGGARR